MFSIWLLLILSVPLYYALRYLWELLQLPDLTHRAVFISGCDTGFGRLLALRLVRQGMLTFAGCLTEAGLRQLRAEVDRQGLPTNLLLPVSLDVTDDESVLKAAEFVRTHLPKGHQLWALVNNAGVLSCYGPDAWTPIEEYKSAMEVNCWGYIRCTHAFLPLLKQSKGRIISISSVAGRVTVPCGAPYSVAKYGVEAYMDAIRLELAVYGITCCILEPGSSSILGILNIDEDLMRERVDKVWARLDEDTRLEYGEKFKHEFVTAWNEVFQTRANERLDDVVDAYFHAITAIFPRARYRIGWDAILIYIPYSFLPTAVGDALFRLLSRAGKKPILPASIERERAIKRKTAEMN